MEVTGRIYLLALCHYNSVSVNPALLEVDNTKALFSDLPRSKCKTMNTLAESLMINLNAF